MVRLREILAYAGSSTTAGVLGWIGGIQGAAIAFGSWLVSTFLAAVLHMDAALTGLGGLAITLVALFLFHMHRAEVRLMEQRVERAEAKFAELGSTTPAAAAVSDWRVGELFHHLRPDLPPRFPEAWRQVLEVVEDQFSTGQITVYGRREHHNASRTSLEPIDPSYWKDADLIGLCVNRDNARLLHTRRRSPKTEWEYRDLHVTKAQCLSRWPIPLSPPVPASDWKDGHCVYRNPRVVLSERMEAGRANDRYIALYDLPPDAEIFYSIETEPKLSTWRLALGQSREVMGALRDIGVEQSVALREHMVFLYADDTVTPPALVVRVLVHHWRRASNHGQAGI
jgi:hypothetical protein